MDWRPGSTARTDPSASLISPLPVRATSRRTPAPPSRRSCLGYPDTTGLETPRAVIQRWPYMATYFQDDWRVTNKLTLNLGLRWEYTWEVSGGALLGLKDWNVLDNYTEGGFSNFNPSVPNPAAA